MLKFINFDNSISKTQIVKKSIHISYLMINSFMFNVIIIAFVDSEDFFDHLTSWVYL